MDGKFALKTIKIIVCCAFLLGATAPSAPADFWTTGLVRFAFLAIGLLIFVLLSALYSGLETATVSLDKHSIYQRAEEGNRKAEILRRLLQTPERTLGMTLMGTNIANVMASQMGLLFVIALLQMSEVTQTLLSTLQTSQEAAATLISTGLILIFGEILPKTIFRARADSLALRYSSVLRISDIAFRPIVTVMSYLANFLVRIADKRSAPTSPDTHHDELRLLATIGEQSGRILKNQRRMIHSVLNLHNRTVEQVMVPLVDIIAVDKSTQIDTFLQTASEAGISRVPVYEEQINNIIGVVNLLDVIYSNGESEALEPFIRKNLQYVPASKNTNVLLKEIQQSHHTMVFVVDEYGGIVGLTTVEDLVEEIIGEFSDERDEPESLRLISPRLLECDGRTEVNVLSEQYDVAIPSGDYKTVAGYILNHTGTIPKSGDKVNTESLIITIADADARRIRKVRIRSTQSKFIKSETTA